MAQSLSYEAIKEMKFADYKKAFKEKSQWRKAKALIILVDYKLGSKKTPIVLPLRRTNELKPLLKQIKADKHPAQKMAAGLLGMRKGEKGPEMTFQMTHGGCALQKVEGKVKPLVQQILKCGFVAEQGDPSAIEEKEETTLENQEENPTPRGTTPNSEDQQTPSSTEETEQEQEQEGSTAPTISSAAIAQTLKSIKALAVKIRKEVVPTIQQGAFGEAQEALITELEGLLAEFQAALGEASSQQLQKLKKHQQFVENKVQPMLDKIKAAVEGATGSEQTTEEGESAPTSSDIDIKKVLKAIKPLAVKIHKEVPTAIKQKTYGDKEAALLEELETLLQQFDTFYQQATPKQQQQLASHQSNIEQKIRPLLEKLQAAAEKFTTDDSTTSPETTPTEETAEQAPQEEENNTPQEGEGEEVTGEQPEEEEEESTLEFTTPEEVEDFLSTAKAEMQQLLESLGLS